MDITTNAKGNLAVAKAVVDLTEKGFSVFTDVLADNHRFDLAAYKEGVFTRIQCKYAEQGTVPASSSWSNRGGNMKRAYLVGDFDYFALYLADIDVVVYPSLAFAGATIRWTPPTTQAPCYFFEDFLFFTDEAEKRTYRDFGKTAEDLTCSKHRQKKIRLSAEEIHQLVWSKPATEVALELGVARQTLDRYCERREIVRPPRGYWRRGG